MEGFASLLRGRLSLKPSGNKLEADLAKPDKRYGESSTSKLPPEILGVIFHQLDRNSTELVRVTAVCSRWRAIATQTPYLWTNIEVNVNHLNKKKTRKVLSRVGLFLGRAGDLPLDVVWDAYGNGNSVPRFYNLFREKGPFIRWRTLSLTLNPDLTHPLGEFRESDSFSNLVRLTLASQPPPVVLERLNKTVSKNLDILELRRYFLCWHDFPTDYAGILHVITTLKVGSGVAVPSDPLPPNVTTLRAVTLPNIAMPHIRHVHLKMLRLVQSSSLNLSNIVLLEVNGGVDGPATDVLINLPNLVSLTLKKSSFFALSAIKAPSLQALRIEFSQLHAQTVDGLFMAALRNGFQVSKLLILLLDIRLDGPTTLEVLRMFPDITHLQLRCCDAKQAEDMLWHVFPEDQRNFNICPSIHAVCVELDTPPANEKEWRAFVWHLGPNIGESLGSLESRWSDGSVWRPVSCEALCVRSWRFLLKPYYSSSRKPCPPGVAVAVAKGE